MGAYGIEYRRGIVRYKPSALSVDGGGGSDRSGLWRGRYLFPGEVSDQAGTVFDAMYQQGK